MFTTGAAPRQGSLGRCYPKTLDFNVGDEG
jgi:hypothetical protein